MTYFWLILFPLLPLSALGYCGWHVWQMLPLGAVWRAAIIASGVLCFALFFVAMSPWQNRLPLWAASVVYDVGCSALIALLYLVLLLLAADLLSALHVMPRAWMHGSWRGVVLVAGMLAALLTYGNIHYHHKTRVALRYQSHGRVSRPYRFVMVSDMHLGYHNRRAELARWIDMFNAEQADALLVAGDIVDGSMRPLKEERMVEEWQRLRCPVYACLGNHEYYGGEPESERFYREAGITLLRDSCTVIDSCIAVIGRDDRTNRHRASLAQLARRATHGTFTILLDHQPYHLEQAERAGIDLQLSGHTHHGQVWPLSWITDAVYECAFGPHRRGRTAYYVSSGLGLWGGKYRIGTRSEYVVITIEP